MAWRVEYLDDRLEREFKALPGDMRAKFVRIIRMIEEHGLHKVGMPYVRHIEGKIWEMRVTGRDGIARGLYVTARAQRVVLVHVFIKKSRTTPREEIAKALLRAGEVDNG